MNQTHLVFEIIYSMLYKDFMYQGIFEHNFSNDEFRLLHDVIKTECLNYFKANKDAFDQVIHRGDELIYLIYGIVNRLNSEVQYRLQSVIFTPRQLLATTTTAPLPPVI